MANSQSSEMMMTVETSEPNQIDQAESFKPIFIQAMENTTIRELQNRLLNIQSKCSKQKEDPKEQQ